MVRNSHKNSLEGRKIKCALQSIGMKECSRCRAVKPVGKFHRTKSAADGRYPYCAVCSRAAKTVSRNIQANKAVMRRLVAAWKKAHPDKAALSTRKATLKRKYGITHDEFVSMVAAQGGRCAVCGITPHTRLAVDHDHATRKVRGLLCTNCNTGIGLFKDSIKLLRAACAYLGEKQC